MNGLGETNGVGGNFAQKNKWGEWYECAAWIFV